MDVSAPNELLSQNEMSHIETKGRTALSFRLNNSLGALTSITLWKMMEPTATMPAMEDETNKDAEETHAAKNSWRGRAPYGPLVLVLYARSLQ